ncbi:hypothetical protein [Aurantiacibacter spongiae]|uniref:Uncharacterized protein n=1 Tax=Aurantiacibacter spongiae TaxID=2488860 RepID=A0A3N5DFP5_9SPHN|nr:hypothetical protein [Aurantiacibacter spongiae]RPF70472.1 hypothetical protein EG799_01630 [Aurantiacibacter spongiae]
MTRAEAEAKGWTIGQDRWPFPAWSATHRDYDASYEGPEDGWVDNDLSCTAKTLPDLLVEIAEIEADRPTFLEGLIA